MGDSTTAFKGLTQRRGAATLAPSMKRPVSLVVVAVAALSACAGPYSAPPESLKRPRPKKRPKEAATATEVAPTGGPVTFSEEPCRTNFFGDPHKGKRKAREARQMTAEADAQLTAAERAKQGRQDIIIGAMDALANALRADPYAPDATYKLAIAYAMVGRKQCSLALLERLKALGQFEEVEAEADRTIQRAARDPAFEPFRTDARRALGQ